MKFFRLFALAAFVFGVPSLALAGEKTVTLKVDGMTCGSCPYQVTTALKRVDGVKKADASAETGEAIVVYDDAKVEVAMLAKAVINAGYPAIVKGADDKAVINAGYPAIVKGADDKDAAAKMEAAKKAAAKRGSHSGQ